MVVGLEKLKQHFEGDEDKYVLIGGAACDINFSNNEIAFRATRDLDMVLIVEALTPDFGEKFWQFIIDGDYQHKATSSGKPQFFRFTDPQNAGYPVMIELFARTEFPIREPNILTPIHIDDEISSLSGILLNEDYYKILLEGRTVVDHLSVLRPEYLILFKAKAYLDLKAKRDAGETVHSSEYKKHKKDVLRIITELVVERPLSLPETVYDDISRFIELLDTDPFDVNTLINYGVTTEEVAQRLRETFL
ncbi:hypothetical protein SAMN02910275_00064 [Butyrivibrio sp. INlla18]|uniref:hypothetical protein n=1 Tax=Butyrivibrio sp. INlla18 TaxID=1520806 RepID=UPI0008801C0C|nr:hypothetical protein [Butyrivibrio sp. INlla18]SDA38072.1 hypothetical protein SAMN02910275_00064 [Butyrivibrio sp. INlla18]